MKSKKLGSLICIILVLSVFIPAIALARAEKPVRVPVIIGFKGAPDLDLVAAFNGKIKHVYTIIPAIAIDLPEEAVSRIAKAKGVAYVEPDYVVEALGETLTWGVDRIDADVVHTYPNKGTGIYVAVLDTGIDYNHPDLDDNYAGGWDFAYGDSDPIDDNGHGTHVSGIIAAEDNTEGVIGVAPEAKIYAVKVLDSRGSGSYSDIIAGIQWAVLGPDTIMDTGDEARVISMSFGGGSDSRALHDALYAAYENGIVLVAAAGNGGDGDPYNEDSLSYPAAYDFVIAVGATDNDDDSLASFSTSASYLELSAPGVSIYSTMPTYKVTMTSSGPPRSRYSNNYDYMSGTSMAAPHVSGTVALVLYSPVDSAYDDNGDGEWDPSEVRAKLIDTAEDLGNVGWDMGYGYGLVDAEAVASEPDVHNVAVTAIDAPSSVVTGETTTIDVTVENQGTYGEDFNVVLTDDTDVFEIGTQSVTLDAGASMTLTFSWDTADAETGDHILTATADQVPEETDITDNSKSTVVTVELAMTDIAITAVSAPSSVVQGELVDVSVTVENVGNQDVDIDITVELTGDIVDIIGTGTISGGLAAGASTTLTFSWDTDGTTIGDHILTASHDLIDEYSNNDSMSTTVTVEDKPSGDAKDIYVWDISFSVKRYGRGGSKTDLMTTVTIRRDSDASGTAESTDDPVSRAAVYMTLTWVGSGESWSFKGDTNDNGQVTFTLKLAPIGEYEAKVTNVEHGTYTYNSTLDADNPAYHTIG